jgi:hypothetical protein
MKHYDVTPLKSVGPVSFGMARADVLAAMGAPSSSFRKTQDSVHPTDAWHGNSFQVFYCGTTPVVQFIELSQSDETVVRLFEHPVFGTPAAELVEHIASLAAVDQSDPEHGYSYIFPVLELCLWRPNQEELHFSTVGAGQAGYFASAT